MSNVHVHQRSLNFHTAARHVMRLACEKAVMLGALRPDDAQALQLAARCKMHTAQVRVATELVFDLCHAARLARGSISAALLPAPRLFDQEPTA
jgi:hypothetical protein